ncbi:hypothetical protein [Acinetobacter beijerinckii]|uniref:hypothetical protein n=1 Tax=Acinetobacter beijerinckii TaxID=262668 RepID=UPI0012DB061F|nr:hypothetical protein [Acinetobacter beijerinckii]
MNQFSVGEKVLYIGLWGSDFNLVDEVVGIVWDGLLQRNKYLIRDSESGTVIQQYGDNYRIADADEIAIEHRLRSNNGKNICSKGAQEIMKSESFIDYLLQCEKVVKQWPEWKVSSLRDAFDMNPLSKMNG